MNTGPTAEREIVLVVDDEPTVRRLARRVLLEDGFEVIEAADGAEALDLVEGSADPLRVVVSDIVMPKLNGVQLLQRLSITHPELPVILMSGYAGPELAERGIQAPCSLLVKPFKPEELVAEVRRCIRGQPR
ncbi:MAG TPA: response regulator [Gemmatimonadales bacterium]|nr:response regulator [Gemmatimonadales bacterium]